ncbi:SpoIIE family protein phosphatase [Pseudobacteriovorax antillogorgiicola]|uniref:Predicted ATPase n=1 Tax=Pseudobacteriovorax antillogorgiicola TaxID=1513793 RepID=A0A1Y6CHF1_9BACT|nr:SpoIIE family protein phosphatase [Pseudobacteriovorax antillogorgiicola]TCS47289.1 putative ATPase [Pseudobacteriovorax antillogorgiicola]SMF62371.1 Predicted ATPase [Pseudobacteriovorax antillogorgiicola]
MDFKFKDYRIKKVRRETELFKEYLATRGGDPKPYILKVLDLTKDGRDFLQYEFRFIKRYGLSSFLIPIDIDTEEGRTVAVYEMPDCMSLHNLAKSNISIKQKLEVAVRLFDALSKLNSHHITLRIVNSHNILISGKDGRIYFSDLMAAIEEKSKDPIAWGVRIPKEHYPYMSPEQTGRIKKSSDYRTDFYSVGICLFELFTGSVPFICSNILEYFNSHVAKAMPLAYELSPSVPHQVSMIIDKLGQKNPESRYVSAWGAKADLQKCWYYFDRGEEIPRFPLAERDVSDKLQFPDRIYGRDLDIVLLNRELNRFKDNESNLVVLEGAAGVGRTSLIEEFRRKMVRDDSLFMYGSFTRESQRRPYEALIEAFTTLIKQMLMQSESQLNYWKTKIRDAVGENGYYISRLIPELELILGKQKQVKSLGPKEEKSRFELTFRNFVGSLSESKEPVILFLDDLQWMDHASNDLLNFVFNQNEELRIFVILGYRSDAEDRRWLLNEIEIQFERMGYRITRQSLQPLQRKDVGDWLQDTFKFDEEELAEFSDLIIQKTRGYPYFIRQFIEQLVDGDAIYFNDHDCRWYWDFHKASNQRITDNTADLLVENFRSLPPTSINVLCYAACLGESFALDELLIVMEEEETVVKQALLSICEEGILLPLMERNLQFLKVSENFITNARFQFTHDRVRLAAEMLMSPKKRAKVHLQIGQAQLSYLTEQQVEDRIYELVNHFNMSLTDQSAADFAVARLNLKAAKRAHQSSAFKASIQYLKNAITLIGEDSWQHNYDTCIEIYKEMAIVSFLGKDNLAMRDAIEEVRVHAKTLEDLIEVQEVEIQSTMAEDKIAAIRIATDYMNSLGTKLPHNPTRVHVAWHLLKALVQIRVRPYMEVLRSHEVVEDKKLEAIMRIGCSVGSAAYLAQPNFSPILICFGVVMGLKNGHVSSMPFAYAGFATILAGVFRNYDEAHQLGEFSRELSLRFNLKDQICRVEHMVWSFINPWKVPVRDCLQGVIKAFRTGMDGGEFEFAIHAINIYGFYAFFSGKNLNVLSDELRDYRRLIAELNYEHLLAHTEMYRQGVNNLMEGSENSVTLCGQFYNEKKHVAFIESAHDFAFYKAVLQLMLAYSFKQDLKAIEFVRQCNAKAYAAVGSFATPTYLFYEALLYIRLIREKRTRWAYFKRRRVKAIMKKMELWSHHCPQNHYHRYLILKGELHHLQGEFELAIKYLNQASDFAEKNGFVHEVALSYELVAQLALNSGLLHIAQDYMGRSLQAYREWGATKKVERLLKEHAHWLKLENHQQSHGRRNAESLDFETFREVISGLAQETRHDKLIDQVMRSSLMFAGGDKGFIILREARSQIFKIARSFDGNTMAVVDANYQKSQDLCLGVVNYVLRTARIIVVDDALIPNRIIPGLERESYIADNLVRSLACLPIIVGGRTGKELIGVIYLENSLTSHVFSQQKIQMLELIGQTAAGRIELSKKSDILEDSLQQAYQVQQAMLPKTGGISSFSVSEYYQAAEHTGGDWYGYYEDKAAKRLYFFIGDVTGHGVSSSLITGTAAGAVYSSLDTLKRSTNNRLTMDEEIEILAMAVNKAVFDTGAKVDRMMTMLFMIFETDTGNGVYINAGHPGGCIIGYKKNRVFLSSGGPLGYLPDPKYRIREFSLERQESIFFYTDGLTENRGPNGEEFKIRRLMKLLEPSKTPYELKQIILKQGRAIWQNHPAEDDCAFVILRWEGTEDDLKKEFLPA